MKVLLAWLCGHCIQDLKCKMQILSVQISLKFRYETVFLNLLPIKEKNPIDTEFLILERRKTIPPWMFEYRSAGNDSNASF